MDSQLEIIDRIVGNIYPVSDAGRQALSEILVSYHLAKGNLFIREGQICRYMTYVHQGMVRQFYIKGGKDLTEHFTYEGGIFVCLESFFCQKPGYLQVEALENTVCYAFPHDALMELVRQRQEIHYFYSGLLENALIISQKKADAHRFESASERYQRLWTEHPAIVKRAPMSYIASYLGMTPETLSRIRSGQLT